MIGLSLVGLSLGVGAAFAVTIGKDDPIVEATGVSEPARPEGRAGSGDGGVKFGSIEPAGISITEFGARCDGVTDDTRALRNGISAVENEGGTLTIPAGTCVIEGSFIGLGNVTIRGAGDSSVLNFTGSNIIMSVDESNVSFSNLRLVHSSHDDIVMFMFSETTASDFTLDYVTVDGQGSTTQGFAMGLWFAGGGDYRNIRVLNSTLTGLGYGIGINSDFVGVVDGITVDNSVFHGNQADDIEINTPAGTSRNITITNSTFRDNLYPADEGEHAGFGVGLANASNVMIRNNTFGGHPASPIHIEDRSFGITIEGNNLSSGSMKVFENHSSYIFIINGTHDVVINGNIIDGSANSHPTLCVYASDGGGTNGTPWNITGSGNNFDCTGFNGRATWGTMSVT